MRGEAARIAEGIGESAGGDQRRRYIINLEAIGSRGAGGDDQSFQCPQNQERNHDHWLARRLHQGEEHGVSVLGRLYNGRTWAITLRCKQVARIDEALRASSNSLSFSRHHKFEVVQFNKFGTYPKSTGPCCGV